MKDWTTFERVACSIIIIVGLFVGAGIYALGQQIIETKAEYYALKMQYDNRK